MKSTIKHTLLGTLILFCCMAVMTSAVADIPPSPGEPYRGGGRPPDPLPEDEPVISQTQTTKPSSESSVTEQPNSTTTVTPKSETKSVKKGCGSIGFADITIMGIVAAAVLQLRRVSKNRKDDDV